MFMVETFGYKYDIDNTLGSYEFEESKDLSGSFFADLMVMSRKDKTIDHYDIEIKRWINKDDCEHTDIIYEYIIARGDDGKWKRFSKENMTSPDGAFEYLTEQDKHCYDYFIEILNAKDKFKEELEHETENKIKSEVEARVEEMIRKNGELWTLYSCWKDGYNESIKIGDAYNYRSKEQALNKLEWMKSDSIAYWAKKTYVTSITMERSSDENEEHYIMYEVYIEFVQDGKKMTTIEQFRMVKNQIKEEE